MILILASCDCASVSANRYTVLPARHTLLPLTREIALS